MDRRSLAKEKRAGKQKATAADAAADASAAIAAGATDVPRLMSTISTFLPHNDRGASGSNRRLVQGLAEVLIWARTEAATSGSPSFAAALKQREATLHRLFDAFLRGLEGAAMWRAAAAAVTVRSSSPSRSGSPEGRKTARKASSGKMVALSLDQWLQV